ncbi:hypothetical protein OS493_029419, partial [Desmophyllum pertusum]
FLKIHKYKMAALEVGFTVAFVISMLVALVGNLLLIYIVWRKPETRTLTSFMFVNMAVADLLTTLFQMPISISYLNGLPWISAGLAGDITCTCFYYAAFTSITASILCLTFIAIDRYCVVFYPLRDIKWFRKAKIISPIIWILSLALMSFTAAMFKQQNSACFYVYNVVSEKFFFVFFFLVNYLLPLIVICILYGAIARKLWSHEVPGNNEAGRNQQTRAAEKNGNWFECLSLLWLCLHCVGFLRTCIS